ncbi:helix-turn-helix domain-containing protein [Psychromonas sp. MME2]|uniref:TetR/AcrR family transcriptional regulator n=1 Tax=unclassified Psychromonas TaxID=2614957 RepID=UPI00339BD8F5
MDKRIRILAAAEKLLAVHGFYGLSMKMLAKTAGVAAGTIYRYFDSKDMLMSQLHQHIRKEAAETIFKGWSNKQTPKQKYDLLWRNAFDAVLSNPQRLTVIDMLYFIPNEQQAEITLFEDVAFAPLIDFYQQGIDEGRFLPWQIPMLITLSFDTSIELAKKQLRQRFETSEQQINQVRDASWLIIQQSSLK